MKVYLDHSNITQNMHGVSRNYRYVLDISATRCPGATLARPPLGVRREAAWTPGATPDSPLWPIYSSSFEKPKNRHIPRVLPPLRGRNLQRRKDISGGKIPLGRTPPGRGDH